MSYTGLITLKIKENIEYYENKEEYFLNNIAICKRNLNHYSKFIDKRLGKYIITELQYQIPDYQYNTLTKEQFLDFINWIEQNIKILVIQEQEPHFFTYNVKKLQFSNKQCRDIEDAIIDSMIKFDREIYKTGITIDKIEKFKEEYPKRYPEYMIERELTLF